MRDWTELLGERLDLRDLSAEQREETVAELADHFGELFEEYRTQGLSESEAAKCALQEVSDWRGLAKDIQRSKREEGMNTRTRHFWLPGLVNFVSSMLALFFATVYVQPRVYFAQQQETTLYLPWLAVLPFCGAAGAWLSRRSGGDRLACVGSSQFTSAAWLSCFCVISS